MTILTVNEVLKSAVSLPQPVAVSGLLAIRQDDAEDESTAVCCLASEEDANASKDPKQVVFDRDRAIRVIEPGLATAVIGAGYVGGGWPLDVCESAVICGFISQEGAAGFARVMERLRSIEVRGVDFLPQARAEAASTVLAQSTLWRRLCRWWNLK